MTAGAIDQPLAQATAFGTQHERDAARQRGPVQRFAGARHGRHDLDLGIAQRAEHVLARRGLGDRHGFGAALCDADLAILASNPGDYADYVAAVRAEYADVPEEEFLAGRLSALIPFVDREIFRTAKGRQLTDAARANLATEINAIADRLGIAVEGSDV